jgi:hypothetical protein
MDDSERTWDLLLREYSEAGQISRQHESLTRTSASVLITVLVALSGYVLTSAASPLAKSALALVGLLASLLAANIVRRHQLYYRSYIGRARAIEEALKVAGGGVLKLYSEGASAPKGSLTISSKTALISFFLFTALVFGVSSVVFICASVHAHAP